jgi:hypothetical protein
MSKVLDRDLDVDEAPLDRRRRPFYKRPAVLIIGAILILLAAVFGIRYYLYAVSHESTDDAFIDAHIVEVSPKISGYISKIYVLDNETVKAGDLLAEIDPNDFQVKVDQARAALDSAKSKDKSASSNVALTRVNSAAGVEEASSGVASAKSEVQTAQAQVAAAHARLEQAQAQVATALANAAQARAEAEAAEADQAFAQADVQRFRRCSTKTRCQSSDWTRRSPPPGPPKLRPGQRGKRPRPFSRRSRKRELRKRRRAPPCCRLSRKSGSPPPKWGKQPDGWQRPIPHHSRWRSAKHRPKPLAPMSVGPRHPSTRRSYSFRTPRSMRRNQAG